MKATHLLLKELTVKTVTLIILLSVIGYVSTGMYNSFSQASFVSAQYAVFASGSIVTIGEDRIHFTLDHTDTIGTKGNEVVMEIVDGGTRNGITSTLNADGSLATITISGGGISSIAGDLAAAMRRATDANGLSIFGTATATQDNTIWRAQTVTLSGGVDGEIPPPRAAVTAIVLTSPDSSYSNDRTPTFEVTVSQTGGTVILYSGNTCNTAISAATSVTDQSAPYKVSVTTNTLTSDTRYSVRAIYTDGSNNPSDCSDARVQYELDTTVQEPTEVILTNPEEEVGNTSTPTFEVTVSTTKGTVTLYRDDQCSSAISAATAVPPTQTSPYKATITTRTLTEGTHTVYAKYTDEAENPSECSTASARYIYTTKPLPPTQIERLSPVDETGTDPTPQFRITLGETGAGSVKLYYDKGDDGHGCDERIGQANVGATDTTVDITVGDGSPPITSLQRGTHIIHAVYVDSDGAHSMCSSEASVSVTYTYNAPGAPPGRPIAIVLSEPDSSPGNDRTPTFEVTVTETGGTVKLYRDTTGGAGVFCDAEVSAAVPVTDQIPPYKVTITTNELQTSTSSVGYDFTAKHTDAANNPSDCSTVRTTYDLDVVGPSSPSAITLDNPSSTPGTDKTPTFIVRTAAAPKDGSGTVQLYDDRECSNAISDEVTFNSSSPTNVSVTTKELTEGTYTVYAIQRDLAKNPSSCSRAKADYEVDESIPEPIITRTSPPRSRQNTATFQVATTETRGTMTLYSDDTPNDNTVDCSTAISTAKTVTGSPISITTNTLATEKEYLVRVKHTDTLNHEVCSASSATYEYDSSIPEDQIPPGIPTAVTLTEPTSPGSDKTPTFEITVTEAGGTVRLYSDDQCGSAISAAIAVPSAGPPYKATVSINELTTDGTYTVYAIHTDGANNPSPCSIAKASYQLNITPPSEPTKVTLTSPSSSPGSDRTPTFEVEAAETGGTVRLYSDDQCNSAISAARTVTDQSSPYEVSITTYELDTNERYTVYAVQTDTLNRKSPCSTTSATYETKRRSGGGVVRGRSLTAPTYNTQPSTEKPSVPQQTHTQLQTHAPSTPAIQLPTIPFFVGLKKGDDFHTVLELQKTLNKLGYLVSKTGTGSPGQETQYFGSKTETALKRFQAAKGLPQTGTVDEQTQREIQRDVIVAFLTAEIQKLQAKLQTYLLSN